MWCRSRMYNLSPGASVSENGRPGRQWERPMTSPGGRSNSYRSRTADGERRPRLANQSCGRRLSDDSGIQNTYTSRLASPTPPLPTAVTPPCAAYPTFDLVRPPKHEQHIVEALVSEVIDSVIFSNVLQT
ncbi:hypothetical protein TRVL_05347 [Trypanosoma vivax]|uniref:Uncharacterized protein n=1 Tax=Trypanosoma vivax (strain Y486) TaxID=1055687 RepID=G0U753_TRYVY|nr:hypothetical protein TRVL_05347 [Trypanosoma vivax]CCC51710.1 conserved hypothetical protein [Trypanosoma vivax Y486]